MWRSDRGPEAIALAESGAQAWRAAARAQQSAQAEHGQFYALAGSVVETLAAIDGLAAVLDRQMSTYRRRRDLHDDSGADPRKRLRAASSALRQTRRHLRAADRTVNTFWSEIGHIGTEIEQGE